MYLLLAQIPDPDLTPVTINTSNTLYRVTDLGLLITRILNLAIGLIGLVILGYLVWGGIDWLTAGEDKGKVEAARSKLTQGIVGLALFTAVFAVYFIVSRFLGLGNHLNITP